MRLPETRRPIQPRRARSPFRRGKYPRVGPERTAFPDGPTPQGPAMRHQPRFPGLRQGNMAPSSARSFGHKREAPAPKRRQIPYGRGRWRAVSLRGQSCYCAHGTLCMRPYHRVVARHSGRRRKPPRRRVLALRFRCLRDEYSPAFRQLLTHAPTPDVPLPSVETRQVSRSDLKHRGWAVLTGDV